jgi:hypothetical protein
LGSQQRQLLLWNGSTNTPVARRWHSKHLSILYPNFFLGLFFFGVFDLCSVFDRGAFGFFVGKVATYLAIDLKFLALSGEVLFFFSGIFSS